MTNFDFLKNFNNELYEIGKKLEEDVLESPRAVTADATLFLENLVKDMYRISNTKMEKFYKSFYKKIDNLYRLGVISYIYKNKLQEAYNLRNKIHKKSLNSNEEKQLAFDLHKRLYYISKKYFKDFCENEKYITIPEYKKPSRIEIHFDNCIICGNSNKQSLSNMCSVCNRKIENANLMLSIEDTFNQSQFTREDLIDFGIDESRAILLLMDLSKYHAITYKGDHYILNPENFKNYLSEIDSYIEIGILITKFYRDEITATEIKETPEFKNGLNNKKHYREFYRLVLDKIEKTFEKNLLESKNIKKSIDDSSIDKKELMQWFYKQMEDFNNGILSEPFILYNELQINSFFNLKRKGLDDCDILKKLGIPADLYNFWENRFLEDKFSKKNDNVKRNQIIKEIKKNKTLNDVLKSVKISKDEFEELYIVSREINDEFYQNFKKEYTQKRQKALIRHLRNNNLNRAIKLSKITKKQFLKWYFSGEESFSDFYIKTTEILMEKYINYRKNDWSHKEILKEINVTQLMFNSWDKHDEFVMFNEFERENQKIDSDLEKRGLILKGIKGGKGMLEAIFYANLTPRDFVELYNTSKREKTEFYLRFDVEYEKSRKKKFTKLIEKEDFYNAIQKSEISQLEFKKWYIKDQDRFIDTHKATNFYFLTTYELMDKYIQSRRDGKNKPDAAKSVGLSNTIINKWLKHQEFEIFRDFKRKISQMSIDLIVEGFKDEKSKMEVSEVYDIPINTVDEFIELGRNGHESYIDLFDLYENAVIPKHLNIFLDSFQTKSFYKSLKNSRLTKEEIDYYYKKGKLEDSEFYKDFLKIKRDIYVSTILSKKSHKIAMKNSCLLEDEFDELKEEIDDVILNERMCIIAKRLTSPKTTGVKLAKAAGISVDEIYEWYFKGKNGDGKYREFSEIFELCIIIPRVMAVSKASSIGIPKKWLLKKLKKEIGVEDYKIWMKNNILDLDFQNISFEGKEESEILEKLKKFFNEKTSSIVKISVTENREGMFNGQ